MSSTYVLSLVIDGKDNASGPFGRASSAVSGFGNIVGGILTAGVLMNLARQVWEVGEAAFQSGIKFESAFTGIIKTTDGLVDAGGKLTQVGEEIYQQFRDLAQQIPLTFEEIAKIGELAGQLGVGEDALASFSNTIAALGVSTNLTTEEAAVSLARLQNIYDISTENMGSNTEHLGSTIVALGNNFATTERDILSFAERIAGAGKIAGLSQPEILAIGAAFSSVGIEAEAGGTAVQKVLLSMVEAFQLGGEKADQWGSALGWTAKEFTDAWATDPGRVFNDFVKQLGSGSESAIQILNDLGLEDQRLVRAFLSLAEANDLLTETTDVANQAWEDNNALMTEAERRYATTESHIQIIKNQFRDFAAGISQTFLPTFNQFLDDVSSGLGKFREFGDVLSQVFASGFTFDDILGMFSSGGRSPLALILSDMLDIDVKSLIESAPWVSELAGIFERLFDFGDGIGVALGPKFESIGQSIMDTVQVIRDNVGPFLIEAFDTVVTWLEENGPLISAFVDTIVLGFSNLAPIMQSVWAVIQPLLQGFLDLILSIGRLIMQVATNDWTGAWNTIQAIALGVWESLKSAFVAFLNFLAVIQGTSLAELGAMWGFIWESIKTYAVMAWASISTLVTNAVTSFVGSVVAKFNEFSTKVTSVFQGISQSITGLVTTIKNNIQNAFSSALNFAMNIASRFVEVGRGVINGIVSGISNNIQKVISALSGVIDKAISSVLSALGIHSPSTVFAEIGQNVVAGFAKGIAGNPLAVDAMEGQAQAVQRPFSSTGNAPTTTNSSSIVINVDGAKDPEAVAREIMKLLKMQGVYA